MPISSNVFGPSFVGFDCVDATEALDGAADDVLGGTVDEDDGVPDDALGGAGEAGNPCDGGGLGRLALGCIESIRSGL